MATLALVAVVASGCGGGEEVEQGASFTLPRTYEQLDLSTPEAAVAEFTSAFVRRDWVTAALILHPDTQASMAVANEAADLSGLVTSDAEAAVVARITVERGGDHIIDAGRSFEIAMEVAMANGGFRVDLASGVDGLTVRSADQFTAVIDGILATNGSDVEFELAPTSDGRWRVRGVRLSNGTPLQVPFSGRPTLGSAARATEATDVWRSTLPNSDPQELLDTIRTLAAEGDHVSIYLLLDSPAQRGIADQLAGATSPDHALLASLLDVRLDATGFPVNIAEAGGVPSEFMTTSESVAPGEALTFGVSVGSTALDVTMSRDSTGGWRLHRMVPAGELTIPAPFAVG